MHAINTTNHARETMKLLMHAVHALKAVADPENYVDGGKNIYLEMIYYGIHQKESSYNIKTICNKLTTSIT